MRTKIRQMGEENNRLRELVRKYQQGDEGADKAARDHVEHMKGRR